MRKMPVLMSILLASLMVAACGKKEEPKPETSAPAASTAPAPAATAPAESAPAASAPAAPAPTASASAGGASATGEAVFKKTCSMCHQAGVAGAPKVGDKADWGPRIAQGKDTLYKHAIEGFTGSKGMMPAKGGNTALSDDEVKAAVDYMASKAS